METAMRTGATILAIAVLLGLLATVGWYGYAGLTGPGEPMPSDNYIALVLGGLAVALVGMALMALYSKAAGAAMTSHLTFTETPDEKRRCKISDGSPRQCYRPRRNQRGFRILNPCPVELLGVMNNPDQETVLRAIEDARRILGEYIEAGQSDAARTMERLIAVLDKNDVVHALDRMYRRRVLRLVTDRHCPKGSIP
jgi:hypothetical protein